MLAFRHHLQPLYQSCPSHVKSFLNSVTISLEYYPGRIPDQAGSRVHFPAARCRCVAWEARRSWSTDRRTFEHDVVGYVKKLRLDLFSWVPPLSLGDFESSWPSQSLSLTNCPWIFRQNTPIGPRKFLITTFLPTHWSWSSFPEINWSSLSLHQFLKLSIIGIPLVCSFMLHCSQLFAWRFFCNTKLCTSPLTVLVKSIA